MWYNHACDISFEKLRFAEKKMMKVELKTISNIANGNSIALFQAFQIAQADEVGDTVLICHVS